jgi:hypothetical protein
MIWFATLIIPAVYMAGLIIIVLVLRNDKVIQMLTEHSYSLNGVSLIFYKMRVETRKEVAYVS